MLASTPLHMLELAPGLIFDTFLPIHDAESLPFYPLVLKLVVCTLGGVTIRDLRPFGFNRNKYVVLWTCTFDRKQTKQILVSAKKQ